MQLNDLSNTQLLLLAILVSFVTSITTGIATVTLLDDSPEPVVQTIQRIVERTVETVGQVIPENNGEPEREIITKETTVVVTEEDLITQAIEQNSKNLVRIFLTVARPGELALSDGQTASATSTSAKDSLIGLGVIIGSDGLIATDVSIIAPPPASTTYKGILSDMTEVKLSLVGVDNANGLALLRPTVSSAQKFEPSVFADIKSLKLGQTVMSLGGSSRNLVGSGIISALITTASTQFLDSTTTSSGQGGALPEIVAISTTLPTKDMLPGTPVFNIFGDVVAITVRDLSNSENNLNFITVNKLTETVALLTELNTGRGIQDSSSQKQQTAGVKNSKTP